MEILAYQGHIENGNMILPENLILPRNAEFIIVFNEPVDKASQIMQEQQKKAVHEFIAGVHRVKNELTEEDFAEIESGKYKMTFSGRELDLLTELKNYRL
jgi:hypothetical protein